MINTLLAKQQAWLALGEDEDATAAAARASLVGCAAALAVLGDNLQAEGYAWVQVERLPLETVRRNVRIIERETGLVVPKVLSAFWELVGGVSLLDLEDYRHVDYWEERGLRGANGFSDGLHIEACTDEWTAYTCGDYADWAVEPWEEGVDYLLTLAPDGYHKDNISGGAPYGVFPGATWKPAWQYFTWPGARRPQSAPTDPPDFLAYLRTAVLECAGFPGLFGVPAFEPVRESLLARVPLF